MPREDTSRYEYLTFQGNEYGGVSVYGWDTYPSHSVLAGQQRKTFLDMFDNATLALAEYPDAVGSHPLLERRISLHHLPDDEG